MKKLFLLAAFGFLALGVHAQSLTTVKNIQIKGMYDFQDEFNEYRMNSFLKYKLEEYGFTVYYDKQAVPAEVEADPCKELKCVVERGKSMFSTKLTIKLLNCKGETVFMAYGESKIKKRDKSYVDAVKNALEYSALKKLN